MRPLSPDLVGSQARCQLALQPLAPGTPQWAPPRLLFGGSLAGPGAQGEGAEAGRCPRGPPGGLGPTGLGELQGLTVLALGLSGCWAQSGDGGSQSHEAGG